MNTRFLYIISTTIIAIVSLGVGIVSTLLMSQNQIATANQIGLFYDFAVSDIDIFGDTIVGTLHLRNSAGEDVTFTNVSSGQFSQLFRFGYAEQTFATNTSFTFIPDENCTSYRVTINPPEKELPIVLREVRCLSY